MESWLPKCVVLSPVPSSLGIFVHSLVICAFAHPLEAEHLPSGSWRHTDESAPSPLGAEVGSLEEGISPS